MINNKQDELLVKVWLKLLRMNGYLLPETEEEVEAFYEIYGHEMVELPEKFKTLDFLFEED